jgi:hypothetical protein
LLPVRAARAGRLHFDGGGLAALLECSTVAFAFRGEAEQRAIADGWAALLNSLSHPIQIAIQTRSLDPAARQQASGQAAGQRAELAHSFAEMIGGLASARKVVMRRRFVAVPWERAEVRALKSLPGIRRRAASRSDQTQGMDILEERVRWITDSLRRIDVQPRRLDSRALAELFYHCLCAETARSQPLGETGDIEDFANLIAPAVFEETPLSVKVGGRLACSLVITRYPQLLQPAWLDGLLGYEGDLDLSLHITPAPSWAVMRSLERLTAELTSTIRIAEEAGKRPDVNRVAALEDASELQERLARGEERLFDASIYLTAWAERPDELESSVKRLEALLGSMLVHSRRLCYQVEPGLISSLPLGLDRVGVRKSLPTSVLAATFPFSGNDLSDRAGLFYGINPQAKSPVLLDRFGLENHNAVVFATSGAGKSYLVKVELLRALLTGCRVEIIDPEGEYAGLVAVLGGTVNSVKPGAEVAIDPFALPVDAPGALSTRVANLLTLVELLCGELSPLQRAAVEEALSFAYASRGFNDEARGSHSSPPRLSDLEALLRKRAARSEGTIRAAIEETALKLDRYVKGAGSWLFHRSRSSAPQTSDLVTYVLAGLPEEDRAAAMFCVLDHVWSSLAAGSARTLVVVDEAWWLMRHPDTARFIHRLVKTARKRNVGLSLVTQDVPDVLASPLGESVITNSALQILMKQAPQALPGLASLFCLTPAEQTWLLNARQGEGLLMAQGKRVPFQVVASQEEDRLIRIASTAQNS